MLQTLFIYIFGYFFIAFESRKSYIVRMVIAGMFLVFSFIGVIVILVSDIPALSIVYLVFFVLFLIRILRDYKHIIKETFKAHKPKPNLDYSSISNNDVMYCLNCGFEIYLEDKMCSNCGKIVAKNLKPLVVQTEEPEKNKTHIKKEKGKNIDKSIKIKLLELNELFEERLISQQEYDKKRTEILKDL